MVCPSCGFPRPDRIADSCAYCDAYPEVRTSEPTLQPIFSEEELEDSGCYICSADPFCDCLKCKRPVCEDHLRFWCMFNNHECHQHCTGGISLCCLCAAKKKLRR